MKTIKKYFIAGLILSFHISIYGQFNTLTPTQSKKANNPKIVEQIKEKMDAGALLVQVYTGFIYEGPAIVKTIIKNI